MNGYYLCTSVNLAKGYKAVYAHKLPLQLLGVALHHTAGYHHFLNLPSSFSPQCFPYGQAGFFAGTLYK